MVSICIPSYNGGEYFKKTLNSIIPHLNADYELIVSDDCSTDGTYQEALRAANECRYVKSYQNLHNLGMDKNFHQAVKLARGRYVWFCGQDDLLGEEIIKTVPEILKSNDLSILNLNFSQYDHEMEICLMKSFFERTTFNKESLSTHSLLVFDGPDDYFRTFTQPPSFLPSVVMLREYWSDSDAKKFYGTHFVQVGLVLLNFGSGRIGAYTTPLIKGRVPNNQWQSNGNKLFEIMTGDILAKKIAFESNVRLPISILKRDIKKYTLNYIFLIYECRLRGLTTEFINFTALKYIYISGALYWIYILPVGVMPIYLLKFFIIPLKFLKKILLKVPAIEILRG